MKYKRDFWLYLEPFVHIISKGNWVLFYSSVSRRFWEFRESPEISTIILQLTNPDNHYIIKIGPELLKDHTIEKFIRELRRRYLGDLIPAHKSLPAPLNMFPAPVVKTKAQIEIKDYLREITFHITDLPDETTRQINNGFYQLGSGCTSSRKGKCLPVEKIQEVIYQIVQLKSVTLNFSGIPYQDDQYLKLINQLAAEHPFHLNIFATSERASRFNPDQVSKQVRWVIFTIPYSKKITNGFCDWIGRLEENQHKFEVHFIVQDTRDVENTFSFLGNRPIRNFQLKPYYNGKNLDFFYDQVFTDKEEIRLSRPGQNQVFSRKLMNDNDIGKLNILPDGSVFANVNDPEIGNIATDSLKTLISKELTSGKSWFRSRTKVPPCSDCIYQFLCPPVSNYELTMNRFNLCKIRN